MVSVNARSYLNLLLHVFIWMLFGFVLLFYQPLSWSISVPVEFWVKQGFVLATLIVVFYVNSKILVPYFLYHNKTLLYIIVILLIAFCAGPLIKSIDDALHLQALMSKAFNEAGFSRPPRRSDKIDVFFLMMVLFITGISTSVTLIQKWQTERISREALEIEKIGAELSFLKAQINPHFFFNTLNNIYALMHIDIADSRRALHKLSRMMRYLLYETQRGITPLSKEVDLVVDYIELMKLRLNSLTTITFEVPKLTKDPEVAAMLFLPYIENAFKYGVSATTASNILIKIAFDEGLLSLTVRNTIFNNSITADEYGGIGLVNTKRRLELLYPDKHTFKAEASTATNEFIVHLTIKIDGTELHSSR
ncbi:sensor histidine kinase [Pedobacter sp.]|uniref:sensor histidine kinase n=1 Tax=Pedobacter sp. TaxID=1411316 RepID=UPI003D7FC805